MGIIRQASHRAVFLDRDGVINQAIVRDGKPYAPTRLADVILLPYVANALDELKSAGFQLIVVTNQPDVARGKVEKADIEEIHTHLKNTLPLDAVYCCYHDDADGCACRKPKPGFLHEAAATYGLDLSSCYMVGDRWRDITAGKAAGCTTFFIDYGYDEQQPTDCDFRVTSLQEVSNIILKE